MKDIKSKTITFRLTEIEYQTCVTLAIKKSKEENRIVNVSEIIRESIKNIKI